MTVTIAGVRIAYDLVQIRTYLHHSEARIDVRDRSIANPGDLVAVTLNGAPILTATVTDVRSSYRHAIIDAVPAVLTTMRRDSLPALIGDGRRAPALARQILGVEADLAAFDMPITRWTTRPRPVSWAWESFLRTLAGVTSLPIGWRFDARDNLTRVEADRSAWNAVTPLRAIRNVGASIIYTATPIQAGDVLPSGHQVVESETLVCTDVRRTVVYTETAR